MISYTPMAGSTNLVGFDVFYTPDPGIGWFGVGKMASGTYTREGNLATVDIFAPGSLTLDGSGNGEVKFDLNLYYLPDVPAGTYELQYWVQHIYPLPYGGLAAYRTGDSYAVGFDVIVVPDRAVVPEPTSLILLGTGLAVLGLGTCRWKKA